MMRKSLLIAALSAVLPFYMSDETSAAAAPSEDPNADASAADVSQESGTTSSATSATEDSGTGTEAAGDAVPLADGGAEGDAGNVEPAAGASTGETASGAASTSDAPTLAEVPAGDTASLYTDANGTPISPSSAPVGDTVAVAADSHAEAKERFAGVLAKLHQFEDEAIDELREDLIAIGTLLQLHSKASTSAATTGDYAAGDLS